MGVERAENGGEKPENNISKGGGFCPGRYEGGSGRRKTVRWNLEEEPAICNLQELKSEEKKSEEEKMQEQKRKEEPYADEGPSTVIFVRAADT